MEGHQEHLDPVAAARRAQEMLGRDRASALLLRDLTRQPGWLYLKELGEQTLRLIEGNGFPRTPDQSHAYMLAGVARRFFGLVVDAAEKCGSEPRDEAETEILKGLRNGTATITHELEKL